MYFEYIFIIIKYFIGTLRGAVVKVWDCKRGNKIFYKYFYFLALLTKQGVALSSTTLQHF